MNDSSEKNIPSRRRFLQRSLGLIPLAIGSGSLLSTATSAEQSHINAVVTDYVPTFFNNDEWRFVLAMTDRLIPSDSNGPGAVSEGVPIYIDKQMELPYGFGHLWYMQGPFAEAVPELGYQSNLVPRETWRRGIQELNHWCKQQHNKVFADLDVKLQEAVIQQLENGNLTLPTVPSVLFFNQMLENTKEGYLADPLHGGNQTLAAWKLIGFPGARADYPQVMDHPNQSYPLEPVSISGKRSV